MSPEHSFELVEGEGEQRRRRGESKNGGLRQAGSGNGSRLPQKITPAMRKRDLATVGVLQVGTCAYVHGWHVRFCLGGPMWEGGGYAGLLGFFCWHFAACFQFLLLGLCTFVCMGTCAQKLNRAFALALARARVDACRGGGPLGWPQ
jgi:hypothetical protein